MLRYLSIRRSACSQARTDPKATLDVRARMDVKHNPWSNGKTVLLVLRRSDYGEQEAGDAPPRFAEKFCSPPQIQL